jgi:hypothetical protein
MGKVEGLFGCFLRIGRILYGFEGGEGGFEGCGFLGVLNGRLTFEVKADP